jgi:hypothetical protein
LAGDAFFSVLFFAALFLAERGYRRATTRIARATDPAAHDHAACRSGLML